MKKTKYRRLAAMAASLLCCLIFTVPAYAQSSETQPETTPAPAETADCTTWSRSAMVLP